MYWAMVNKYWNIAKPNLHIVSFCLNVVLILPNLIHTFNNFPSDAPNLPINQEEFNIYSDNLIWVFVPAICLVATCWAANIMNGNRQSENFFTAWLPDVDFLLLGLGIFQVVYYLANFIDLHWLGREHEESLKVLRLIYMTFVVLSFTIEIVVLRKFEKAEMSNWAANFGIAALDVGFLFNMSKNPSIYYDSIHLAIKLLGLIPIYDLNSLLKQHGNAENDFQGPTSVMQNALYAYSMSHSAVLSSVFSTVNPFINGLIHTNPSQNPDSMFILATLFGLVVPIATAIVWFCQNECQINRRLHIVIPTLFLHIIVLILSYIFFDQISFEGFAMKQERLELACVLYSLNIMCTVFYSTQLLDYLVNNIPNRQGLGNIIAWTLSNAVFWISFRFFRSVAKEYQLFWLIFFDVLGILVYWKLEQVARNRRRRQNNNGGENDDGDQPGGGLELWTDFCTICKKWPNCLAPYQIYCIPDPEPNRQVINQVGNN